jgi:hypothetical protein
MTIKIDLTKNQIVEPPVIGWAWDHFKIDAVKATLLSIDHRYENPYPFRITNHIENKHCKNFSLTNPNLPMRRFMTHPEYDLWLATEGFSGWQVREKNKKNDPWKYPSYYWDYCIEMLERRMVKLVNGEYIIGDPIDFMINIGENNA